MAVCEKEKEKEKEKESDPSDPSHRQLVKV
jgi:hypothetical protein